MKQRLIPQSTPRVRVHDPYNRTAKEVREERLLATFTPLSETKF